MKRISLLTGGMVLFASSLISFWLSYTLMISTYSGSGQDILTGTPHSYSITNPNPNFSFLSAFSFGIINWVTFLIFGLLLLALSIYLFRKFSKSSIQNQPLSK